MVQVFQGGPSRSQMLAESLGGGLQQGISQMLEKKSNINSANSLADQLNLKGSQKNSFVNFLGNFPAKEQPKALEQYVTSQAIMQYLGQTQQQSNAQQGQTLSATSPISTQEPSITTAEQPTQALPTTPPKIPAVGKLIGLARQQTEEEKIGLRRQDIAEKRFDRSYEMQKDFINTTTNKYKTFETETKPKLLQLQNLSDKELIGAGAAKFLELMDIPLGILENPSNELYQKTSQDLMKGLPETYGNKILLAEVQNFLKTSPTLMNSANGKRMIASNILKLGEMKKVFYDEMRRQQMNYIDKGEKFPLDFEQRVFDNVLPQINRINDEFVKLSNIKDVPPNTIPYFNPQGGISFVPKDPDAINFAETNGGKRIW